MPWWFSFWSCKQTRTQSFHTLEVLQLVYLCIVWLTSESPISILLGLHWYLVIVFLQQHFPSTSFVLSPSKSAQYGRKSVQYKSTVIFIYLALKGKWRRTGVFSFSSLVIWGNTVVCMFLILFPLPQSLCHPYFCMQHLKYLSWVGTGPRYEYMKESLR